MKNKTNLDKKLVLKISNKLKKKKKKEEKTIREIKRYEPA